MFTLIGALGYIDVAGYGASYGSGMAKLYSFTDLMGTWTAVFAFGFIMLSIYGGLKNRKTQKIQTDAKSYFKVAAIISIVSVSLSLAVNILMPIIDLFLLSQVNSMTCLLYTSDAADDYLTV